jgi:hypothetical protein
MSEIHEGGYSMGPGLREQISTKTFHKIETQSRAEFDELMKIMNHMKEVERKKVQLKEELKKLKGPKKNLLWKN